MSNELKNKILQGAIKSLDTIGNNNLKQIINQSEREKREYGLMFCGDEIPPFGNISSTGICTGERCNVEISDCTDKFQIGTFHTHPRTEKSKNIGNLSGEDVHQTISHKQSFSCLGLFEGEEPTVKCFIPGLYINPIVALNSFRANEEYNRKLAETKRQRTKKNIEELVRAYDKRIIADDELYQESKALADKLHKADLIIKLM